MIAMMTKRMLNSFFCTVLRYTIFMRKYLRNVWVLLGVIVLLGMFLRFFHLGETSFVADEFLDINSSYGYFKTGQWQAWDFNSGQPSDNVNAARDSRAAGYKWQVAQLFKVLPPTEATARTVSVAWGMVTLLLVFSMTVFFTKRKDIGLLAAFLYAVSLSALVIDRRLRMYAMFVPVFLALSWVTYCLIEREYNGKIRWLRMLWERFGFNFAYFVPTAALGLLGLHLHLLTVMIVPMIVIYAAVRAYQMRQVWNKYMFILTKVVVVALLAKLFVPHVFELITSSFSFPDNHYGYFGIVLKDYSHALLAMLFFGLGVWHLIRRKVLAKEGWWLVLSFGVPLFMAVFMWDRNVGEQYISFAQPFKVIVIAAGIFALAQFLHKHLKTPFGKKAFLMPMLLALLIVPNYSFLFADESIYHETSRSSNPSYKKVFAYVVKNRLPEDVLITRDMRNYYWSGTGMHVENIGGEVTKDKLTLERLHGILSQYQSGWVVLSDNDDVFVSNDAMSFIEKNMERINTTQVRGKALVYRWHNSISQ